MHIIYAILFMAGLIVVSALLAVLFTAIEERWRTQRKAYLRTRKLKKYRGYKL